MKLEAGMYARTLNGIVKIDKIQDNVMKDTKGHLHYGDFVKASYKIIDILEVGDYVNGCRVHKIANCITIILDNEENISWVNPSDIKSILTKEQFESMSYKLED